MRTKCSSRWFEQVPQQNCDRSRRPQFSSGGRIDLGEFRSSFIADETYTYGSDSDKGSSSLQASTLRLTAAKAHTIEGTHRTDTNGAGGDKIMSGSIDGDR